MEKLRALTTLYKLWDLEEFRVLPTKAAFGLRKNLELSLSKEALERAKIPPPCISFGTWKKSELSPCEDASGLTEIPRSPPPPIKALGLRKIRRSFPGLGLEIISRFSSLERLLDPLLSLDLAPSVPSVEALGLR